MERPRTPVWILLLIFILTIWNPATLALQAASTVWNIETRATLSLAIFIILHNAAWYLYLQISRRVRAVYGLESHV